MRNRWLWFHILAADFLSNFLSLGVIAALAVAWELVEIITTGKYRLAKIYGSIYYFLLDSLADILFAVMVAWL